MFFRRYFKSIENGFITLHLWKICIQFTIEWKCKDRQKVFKSLAFRQNIWRVGRVRFIPGVR